MPDPKVGPVSGKAPSAPQAKPTLKTIAKISGLAVPTVSRALNNAPDIGEKTKILVRQIAKDIGYVPNRAGVRLRTGRTNVIALVMPTEHDLLNHSARIIGSIAHELRGTEFHLSITPFSPDQDPLDPVRYIVETRSADGVIFNRTQRHDPRVAYLLERKFPFVTHGRSDLSASHAYYEFDNAGFARQGLRMLADRGRKNVLFLPPPADLFYAQDMISGAAAAAKSLGVTVTTIKDATTDDRDAVLKAAFQRALAATAQVDAILCGSTVSAMSATSVVEATGATVGQEIDILAKEAIPFLNAFRPAILAIPENAGDAGTFLARAAIQAIKEPGKPPMQKLHLPSQA